MWKPQILFVLLYFILYSPQEMVNTDKLKNSLFYHIICFFLLLDQIKITRCYATNVGTFSPVNNES